MTVALSKLPSVFDAEALGNVRRTSEPIEETNYGDRCIWDQFSHRATSLLTTRHRRMATGIQDFCIAARIDKPNIRGCTVRQDFGGEFVLANENHFQPTAV